MVSILWILIRNAAANVDKLSVRYGSTPKDRPQVGKSIEPHWKEMLSNYYDLMGWDRDTGLPLPEILRDLGLEYLVKDLEQVKQS